jgi:hypothetical protein
MAWAGSYDAWYDGGMRREWKSHVDPASRGPLLYAERHDVPNGLTLTNASEQELLLEVLALAERVRELEADKARIQDHYDRLAASIRPHVQWRA